MAISHFYDDTEERENERTQKDKCGDYANAETGCTNCGRNRVMLGSDGKHRCEKCCWCLEDGDYDLDLCDFLN